MRLIFFQKMRQIISKRGIQKCLEKFHRGCVDYLRRQFVLKWDSPNDEGELATARTSSLLVEFKCLAAQPLPGWRDEGGRHEEKLGDRG